MSEFWSAAKQLASLVGVEVGTNATVTAWEESDSRAGASKIFIATLSHSRPQDALRPGTEPTMTEGTVGFAIDAANQRGRTPAQALDFVDGLIDSVVAVALRQDLDGYLDGRVHSTVGAITGPLLAATADGHGAVATVAINLTIYHP